MRPLPELQRAFFAAIAPSISGASAASSAAVEEEIRDDDRLSAEDRVAVYARMYVARLVGVMREDFPRVAAVLGGGFEAVARAYVALHPSTHPSLRWFGRHFPEFLAKQAGDWPGFVADLARLEWARLDVFDAADATPLAIEDLRQIPPEAWAALRLSFVPAVRSLHVGWPVHRIWEAIDQGRSSSECDAEETWLRVWREDVRVYQAPMDAIERRAFASVDAGEEFGTLCAALAAVVPAERAAASAGAIVLRWLEDGMLAASPANGD